MNVLDKHQPIVEIIFASALFIGLIYSIHVEDSITVGVIVGGILGYLKGRSDGKTIPNTVGNTM